MGHTLKIKQRTSVSAFMRLTNSQDENEDENERSII